MAIWGTSLANTAPFDYQTPGFPGLYWPYRAPAGTPKYLYYARDIWRFTLLWTLLIYGVFHGVVAGFVMLMQMGRGKSAWQYVWMIPFIAIIAAIEAIMAGSIIGLILGAVYNAGYFRMSTWIPFLWGLINILVLTLSSFSFQGGL